MSEQEATQEEALTLSDDPTSQMSAIMDFLAPEAAAQEDPPAGEAGEAAPAEPGSGAPDAQGDEPEAAPAEERAPGTPGVGDVPDAGTAAGTPAVDPGAGQVSGTVDANTLVNSWGELATSFEDSQAKHLHNQTLAEVQEEYKPYFDRLRVHPRQLVGQEVQSVSGPGKETLRDTEDAKQWQEAVKHLLAQDIENRVSEKQEELRDAYSTVHASIDLFRNNADLVPGTRQFNRELAQEFTTMVKDFEVRNNGKLIGYSVPVQPFINQIRTRLAEARSAVPTPQQKRAADQPRTPTGQWDGPQAGIQSKAGSSSTDDNPAAGLMDAFFRQNGMRF